ncbi:MAG: hypothetical protein ABSH36_15255, partial [Solirubrobacteraceae bacterium]
LQQLGATSASAGDHTAAQRYLREADELIATKCRPVVDNGPVPKKWMLCSIAAAAVAAGGAIGWAIGSSTANAGHTTTNVTVTTVVNGHTVTLHKTVTLPIRTVTKTGTAGPTTQSTTSQGTSTGSPGGETGTTSRETGTGNGSTSIG